MSGLPVLEQRACEHKQTHLHMIQPQGASYVVLFSYVRTDNVGSS